MVAEAQRNAEEILPQIQRSSRLVCSKNQENVLLLVVVPAWRRACLRVMRTRQSAHDRSRLGPQRPSRSMGQAGFVFFLPNSRLSCQAVRPVDRHARIRKAGPAIRRLYPVLGSILSLTLNTAASRFLPTARKGSLRSSLFRSEYRSNV